MAPKTEELSPCSFHLHFLYPKNDYYLCCKSIFLNHLQNQQMPSPSTINIKLIHFSTQKQRWGEERPILCPLSIGVVWALMCLKKWVTLTPIHLQGYLPRSMARSSTDLILLRYQYLLSASSLHILLTHAVVESGPNLTIYNTLAFFFFLLLLSK